MDPAVWDAQTLAELPEQQRREGRWADLEVTLFGDPSFLEAKVAAGMLVALIEDYRATADDDRAEPSLRRSALLVEEALRRDRRFIASHREESSHVLFQCVWNAFVGARRAAGPADPAEGDPLARIERLLSAWRAAKDRATPGFPWVRSILPPATAIGSGMIEVVRGHGNAVGPVVWSADGERIAYVVSRFSGHDLVLRDARTLEVLAMHEHYSHATGLAVCPQTGRLAVACSSGPLLLVEPGSASVRELKVPDGLDHPEGVAFSPDGSCLAVAACGGVQLWRVGSGAKASVFTSSAKFRGDNGLRRHVGAPVFTADGAAVVVPVSDDKTTRLRLFDSVRCQPAGAYDLDERVRELAVLADGGRLVCALEDHSVRVFSLSRREWVVRLGQHRAWIRALSISKDGRRIASASSDGTARVWDADSGHEVACLEGHEGDLFGVALSPRGEYVATGGMDHSLRVWDVSRVWPARSRLREEDRWRAAKSSRDGRWLAVVTEAGGLRLFGPDEEREPVDVPEAGRDVACLAFTHDGASLLFADAGKGPRVLDLHSRVVQPRIVAEAEKISFIEVSRHDLLTYTPFLWLRRGVRDVAFSADGTSLATFTRGLTRLWDAVTQKMLKELNGQCDLRDLTSPSSDRFALDDGYELAFLSRSTWKADAWFPDSFLPLSAGPGRWAGANGQARVLVFEGRRGR